MTAVVTADTTVLVEHEPFLFPVIYRLVVKVAILGHAGGSGRSRKNKLKSIYKFDHDRDDVDSTNLTNEGRGHEEK